MLRLKLEQRASNDQEFYEILSQIYGGNPTGVKRSDLAGTEDELRSKLLKAGAPAFVPEDSKAFLPLGEIVQMIRDAGGIPTYPILLDGTGGEPTEFELGKEKLVKVLSDRGFQSVEFIPLRNRFELLKEYAEYFYNNGFVVSFGTEHNTTAMRPITVSCKEGVPLDESLVDISFRGAAFVAAHQYLTDQEGKNYSKRSRDEMELVGKAVFQYYFNSYNPPVQNI
jgi:hypothetical protein